MTLGQLIDRLEKENPDKVCLFGFGTPDSYRGWYERVAFEPDVETKVSEMLVNAKKAVGATFSGYKGGEYLMTADTDCYLAFYGRTGPELTEDVLNHILSKEVE